MELEICQQPIDSPGCQKEYQQSKDAAPEAALEFTLFFIRLGLNEGSLAEFLSALMWNVNLTK